MYKLKRLHLETKYTEGSVASQAFSNAGTMVLLNGVALGDTNTERIGRKVKAKNIKINIGVVGNAASSYDFFRVIIFRFKDARGGTPVGSGDLLSATTNPMAYRLLQHYKRYKVYKDKLFTLTNTSSRSRTYRFKIPLSFIEEFGADSNLSTAIQRNSLWLFVWTSAVGNQPLFNTVYRYGYTDN